jgi:diguanylate cyclase (GGDEF)-like protein/PAS domain S-box-containing protein
LAKVGVLLALIIGFMMTSVQIYLDHVRHVDDLRARLHKILLVAKPPAERAVYTLDVGLAKEVATGLSLYDFIIEVTLKDELGQIVAKKQQPSSESQTSWITEFINERYTSVETQLLIDEKQGLTGTLAVVVDMDAAIQPFYRNSAELMLLGFVRSFILVLCLFFTFHYMLTKPLIKLSNEIKSINPGSPGEQRVSLNRTGSDDELNQLALSANQLLEAVDIALSKRRAVEVVLRKSEEHVRQIIDSLPVWVGARNRDGHYIFANKALADFLQTNSGAMRGSHVAEFKDFFVTEVDEILKQDKKVIESKANVEIWEEKWIADNGEEFHMHTHIMPMEFYDETVALIVSSDITELKVTQALMEHMAYHDALTDLPNRSYLLERLGEELRRARKRGTFGAVLFIDLDQFKHINDSLGHPAGDAVLKHVAKRLRTTLREDDIVVRLGGDEFVVVLSDLGVDMESSVLQAESSAERIRDSLSEKYFYKELELHVTGSVGIAMFPDENSSVPDILRYADTAMYKVKEQGRDSIEFFNKGMAESAKNVLVMEDALHKALENQHFMLHYQPRVDTETSKIIGAEALLRWEHSELGMVPPAQFIPVLETSGLIVDVGMWVLRESISQVKKWIDEGLWYPDMRLGVNISPRQFRSANFVSDVANVLYELDFPGSMIEMEITEGIAIQNLDVTIETMTTLQGLGIVFALDDFGTGYSSISYLKQLPVAVLKIDKSFVRDITEDGNDRVLVETITAMGNMLELEVVAEGVETIEQLSILMRSNCRYYQGYLCSPPVSESVFIKLLDRPEVDWVTNA